LFHPLGVIEFLEVSQELKVAVLLVAIHPDATLVHSVFVATGVVVGTRRGVEELVLGKSTTLVVQINVLLEKGIA
jgi:hypothetical protein